MCHSHFTFHALQCIECTTTNSPRGRARLTPVQSSKFRPPSGSPEGERPGFKVPGSRFKTFKLESQAGVVITLVTSHLSLR